MASTPGRCFVVAVLITMILWSSPTGAVEGVAPDASETASDGMLLGEVSRSEIERAMPEWVSETVTARPDPGAAVALLDGLQGAEVTVFFGTWCSDSGRELPRLWAALDLIVMPEPPQIRYVGVDRGKTEPSGEAAGQDLRLVPTFIVRRDSTEVGRVVESSPAGIEVDLLALLVGEKSGLITGSAELQEVGDVP